MKYSTVVITASTDTELVAAPEAGKVIRVLGLAVSAATALSVAIHSGSSASGAKLFGFALGNTSDFVLPIDREGWADCAANESLVFKGSATGSTTVTVRYAIYG